MLKGNKIRTVIAFLLLALLSFIDQQYFYEPLSAASVNPLFRQIMHIVILLAFIPIGYWAMLHHRLSWLKKLWVGIYITFIGIMISIGAFQILTHIVNVSLLDFIAKIRLFVESPLLFLIMLFLSQIISDEKTISAKKA